MRDVISIY